MQVLRLGKLQNKVGKEISDGHAFSKHVIKVEMEVLFKLGGN